MLLPSRIILLVQVYIICLVNASSVFVNYLDGSPNRQTDDKKTNELDNELFANEPSRGSSLPVRAAIASKVLPEVRANNRFSSFYEDGRVNNQVIIESTTNHKSASSNYVGGDSNSIDSSPMDFESYSVTISPTLMLNANDKDQEGLEEKIETHTNNHNSLLDSHNHQMAAPVDKSNHNTRHYNTYQPAKHHLHPYSSAASKYPAASPTSFSNNLNLNYIHSLLLTKPGGQAATSLSALLHGLSSSSSSSSSSTSGGNPSSSSHHSAPSSPTSPHQQTNMTAQLDLSGGASICGRQQVAGSSREPRIVGGNNSYEGEFPWAVSIQRHGNHHCGGVIVGRRWILTAAHCVRSQLVANLLVRTGGNTLARSGNHLSSHLERDYLVDQILMHNDFSRYDNLTASQMKSSANTNNADIALLRLKQEIHWNELAWPVCFPPREAGNFSGHDAVVIGWGKLNEKSEEFSNELQKVKLTIIDNKVCQNWFRLAGREMPIDDRVICAGFKNGGKDACHGDSGGPLLSKINGHYAVVGVVSTGIGCARPLLPGLYSRVSSYIGWIERHIVT